MVPSVFFTKTAFETKGDLDFLIILADNTCSMCYLTSSIIDGGILRYLCLNGDSSDRLIWCFTSVKWPISVSPLETMPFYSLSSFHTFSFCWFVSDESPNSIFFKCSDLKYFCISIAKELPNSTGCISHRIDLGWTGIILVVTFEICMFTSLVWIE